MLSPKITPRGSQLSNPPSSAAATLLPAGPGSSHRHWRGGCGTAAAPGTAPCPPCGPKHSPQTHTRDMGRAQGTRAAGQTPILPVPEMGGDTEAHLTAAPPARLHFGGADGAPETPCGGAAPWGGLPQPRAPSWSRCFQKGLFNVGAFPSHTHFLFQRTSLPGRQHHLLTGGPIGTSPGFGARFPGVLPLHPQLWGRLGTSC